MLLDIAKAEVKGGKKYPRIKGIVNFRQTSKGVLITAKIYNLPTTIGKCNKKIFGFHIHEGSSCSGNEKDEFADTKSHYNPSKVEHPMHAGDLPPILSANGIGILSTFTNRFTVEEVIGKSFIIHSGYDDFTSQPAGNAGTRWACGVIDYY